MEIYRILLLIVIVMIGYAFWLLFTKRGRFSVIFGGYPSEVDGDIVSEHVRKELKLLWEARTKLASFSGHLASDDIFSEESKIERSMKKEVEKREKRFAEAVTLAKHFGFHISYDGIKNVAP
jgi:hypothetical protein